MTICVSALASQAACFPAMLHGPRVERGFALSANVSMAAGPTHTEGDEGGLRLRNGTAGLGLGYGWRAAKRKQPSVFVGAYVPIAFPAAQLDVFTQAPEAWTGPTSGGVGVNVAWDHVAPYLQWGMVNARGSGWSILQGVSVRTDENEQDGQVAWTPGVAAHFGLGQQRVYLYAMGAFGRLNRTCFSETGSRICAGDRSYALLAGLAYEYHFWKAATP